MSERELLYYPSIVIPRRTLQWGLLYWDKIRSIVPTDYNPNRFNLLNDVDGDTQINNIIKDQKKEVNKNFQMMNIIKDHGYYEEIVPTGSFDEIYEELEIILDSPYIAPPSWENWSYDYIHLSKMNAGIVNLLYENRLLLESNRGEYWYKVEKNMSILYMSLLARFYSDNSSKSTVPYTDSRSAELLTYRHEKHNNLLGENEPFISVNFENLLPAPSYEVSVFDVLKFKSKHEDELLQLRVVIDDFQSELLKANSKNQINHINTKYKEKMEIEKRNITKLFQESDWSFITTSLTSLVGVGMIPNVISSLNNQSITLNQIQFGSAIVLVGCALINRRLKKNRIQRDSPYAYLYEAKKSSLI